MNRKEIFLLTGPIRSGKTTSLQSWISDRKNCTGLLTPVADNKRKFLDIGSGEYFDMEAGSDETDVLSVGRFRFNKHSFNRAIDILSQPPISKGWRLIDEIGPLELRGEGFGPVLRTLLDEYAAHEMQLLLVVRDTLLDEVCNRFRLDEFDVVVIGKNELDRLL